MSTGPCSIRYRAWINDVRSAVFIVNIYPTLFTYCLKPRKSALCCVVHSALKFINNAACSLYREVAAKCVQIWSPHANYSFSVCNFYYRRRLVKSRAESFACSMESLSLSLLKITQQQDVLYNILPLSVRLMKRYWFLLNGYTRTKRCRYVVLKNADCSPKRVLQNAASFVSVFSVCLRRYYAPLPRKREETKVQRRRRLFCTIIFQANRRRKSAPQGRYIFYAPVKTVLKAIFAAWPLTIVAMFVSRMKGQGQPRECPS